MVTHCPSSAGALWSEEDPEGGRVKGQGAPPIGLQTPGLPSLSSEEPDLCWGGSEALSCAWRFIWLPR